ncbi:MAG: serine hydrolase domain-containing protein [Solirubrobacteraceae bacterium]
MDLLPSLPRLPMVPDPLRRVRLPSDPGEVTTLGPEEDPGELGSDGVEGIWSAAVDLYRSGVHPAVQICVRHRGALVLNRALGHARGNGPHDDPETPKVPATPDTPMVIYSGAKAVTATLVHLLQEQGLLDIADPVSKYVPQYGRNGKEKITIGHILSHRAGTATLPREAFDLDRASDSEYLLETISSSKPFAAPGKFLAYQAVSGGFVLAEVVRQVTGQDIRTALAQNILDPLGMRWTNYGVASADIDTVALNYVTGPPTGPPFAQLMTRALGLPFDELVQASNDPRFLTATIPSANIVTTAHELSRFYEMLRRGGELDGVTVMAPATILRALTQQSHFEVDLSLGFPTRFSYGLMLGARLLSLYGRDTQHAFGHLGFTNILAWADPERALACAVLTNGKPALYPEMYRFYGLMQRITSTPPKVSGSEMRVWDPLAGRPEERKRLRS